MLTILRERNEAPVATSVYRPRIPELFRIPEGLLRMRALVAAMTAPRPLAAFWPKVPKQKRSEPVVVRSAVASTFVTASEPCREAAVGLDQEADFGAIMVSPRARTEDLEAVVITLENVVRIPCSHVPTRTSCESHPQGSPLWSWRIGM